MFLGFARQGTSILRTSRIVLTRPENPVEESLGVIMRKLALLLAASLIVTAPLLAMSTNDTYAAAKAKKAAAKGGAEKGGKASPGDSNTAFMRAVGDLGASLGQPRTASDEGGKGKKAKAGKSGGGKAAKAGKSKKSKA
jgi:hypothetical protein